MKFHNLFNSSNDRLAKLLQDEEVILSTGLDDLDEALGGGIAEGEFVIVGGRPSHGKTTLVLNMLASICEQGIPCLLVSEEMSVSMLAEKLLYMATPIPKTQWREKYETVVEDLAEHWGGSRRPLLIAEHCGNIEKVCNAIREARDNHGVKVVAVDYMQLIRAPGNGRYEQVTNVSVSLKQCAHELDVTLLVAAQLGRGIETRPDQTPKMSDLRESGQIEQDGDVILFGYWPWQVDNEYCGQQDVTGFSGDEEYRVFVAKNKNRGVRKQQVFIGFDKHRQTFRSREAEDMPNYDDTLARF